VVWGTQPDAVKSLTTWLLKQGYIVVDELKIRQLARENNSAMPLSDVEVLRLARTAGAKEVIFVDANVVSWKTPEVLELLGQNLNALANGIHQLTCNALATGWGLRNPGITANTNVCPHGRNVMVLRDIPSTSKEEVVTSTNKAELDAHALSR
jgi:hypothetical protein